MSLDDQPPFDDSRRLTGPNFWFPETGAVLETRVDCPIDDVLLDSWRRRVVQAREALDWPAGKIVHRRHRSGVSLAFTAPIDQLLTATEVNEWAWCGALDEQGIRFLPFLMPGHPSPLDDARAWPTLRALANAERNPQLMNVLAAAGAHGLPCLIDDETVSLGAGSGHHAWPMAQLPSDERIEWPQLHDIPTALVTGSNGKTTTVRLLAAMMRAHGWRTAHSCTDGLYFDGEMIEGGDYSGPVGARTVLRHPQAQAAVLETARGGMLRRGLAVDRADVAVITNVSEDHFGEYGIDDLDALTQVKLTVAHAIGPGGTLVLNADDPQLVRHAVRAGTGAQVWFALDYDHADLEDVRRFGGTTAGPRAGTLLLSIDRHTHDLGAVADMPITLGGHARHNIANIAAASLAAASLGIAPATIAQVLVTFGRDPRDNAGRLQRWSLGTATVYLDYAHNPDGLWQLLDVATHDRAEGRLALILGQAGNRGDDAIAELAGVAASFRPDLVVLKDIVGYMRGRGAGDVANVIRTALREHGVDEGHIIDCLDEAEAVRVVLAWAKPHDLMVLPIHGTVARKRVCDLLDELDRAGWKPGDPLPEPTMPNGETLPLPTRQSGTSA